MCLFSFRKRFCDSRYTQLDTATKQALLYNEMRLSCLRSLIYICLLVSVNNEQIVPMMRGYMGDDRQTRKEISIVCAIRGGFSLSDH